MKGVCFKMGLTFGSLFDVENKKARLAFALVALVSAVGIIFSVFGMFAETSLVLPTSIGEPVPMPPFVAQNADSELEGLMDPDTEVRGVWIATVNNINFPSERGLGEGAQKRELDSILDTCEKNGLNTIYFQVRPSSDALYASKLFPSSEYLTGKQGAPLKGGFDPLDYLVSSAHARGIKIHAWVNPLRVTYGTKSSPAHDLDALAESNPARRDPNYTVAYADGKLYYNAGIPEVREIIVDGVREIAENYDVDGIVFDDYFYPYASYTDGVRDEFDDSLAYASYGGDISLDDWRRDNINKLVKSCYDAIKQTDDEMLFGISPFGIWQNDDGKNGGSATAGTEAYSELYCDALAWIEGGYIDYIAPQIYWSFTNNAARYDTLVRWWNAACDSTGVDLLISHAAYKYGDSFFDDDDELLSQIEFARSEMSYKGSVLYGYAALANDTEGICDELAAAFSRKIVYTSPVSDMSGVSFNSPAPESMLTDLDTTYLLGSSDPAYPVYLDGEKLSRTKSGYFSVMLPLKKSTKNTFAFTQNGKSYDYTVYNGISRSTASGSQLPADKIMSEYEIVPVTPKSDLFLSSGEKLRVTVKAPAGSSVVCTLADIELVLSPTKASPGTDKLYEMTYSAELTLPTVRSGILTVGKLKITAKSGDKSASLEPAEVRVGADDAVIPIEVSAKRTGLKVATDSYYYDDFTSQACGMRDNAVRLENGYYLLRVGGYVAASDAVELEDRIPIAKVDGASVLDVGENVEIRVRSSENIPMNGRVEDGYFILNLYNVDTTTVSTPELHDNSLFESVEYQLSTKANCFRYHLKLKDPDNFFGFEFAYEDGCAVVRLRAPKGLAEGELPLDGRVIVLDAGHGGSDMGASGSNASDSEAALNLKIVLAASEKLASLGANVVLTREDDSYVALTDRMNYVEQLSPDIMISVHQNSMDYSVDITKVRGLMALYWEYAGKSLSETMASTLSRALGRSDRGAATQRLAMVRCERYPSTLIEVGFMTSVEEYERICSPDGIETAAQAIADGVLEYYAKQK